MAALYYLRKHNNKMYSSVKTWRVIISVLFCIDQGTVQPYYSVISLSTVSYFTTDQNKHFCHFLIVLIHIHIIQYLITTKPFKCLVLHDFTTRSACTSSIKALLALIISYDLWKTQVLSLSRLLHITNILMRSSLAYVNISS